MSLQTKTAIKTLRKFHKKLALELKASEKNSARVRVALSHVEAVITMLEPGSPMAALANARRRNKVLTFRRGEPTKLTFQILREASEPLTVREIAERMFRIGGRADPDERSLFHLRHAVRNVLRAHKGKTVTVSEGVWPERWAIIQPNKGRSG
jgi:hypothetical protein